MYRVPYRNVFSDLGARDYSRAWNFVLEYRNPRLEFGPKVKVEVGKDEPIIIGALGILFSNFGVSVVMSSQYHRPAWNFICQIPPSPMLLPPDVAGTLGIFVSNLGCTIVSKLLQLVLSNYNSFL